jgi:hypothetical protein
VLRLRDGQRTTSGLADRKPRGLDSTTAGC